MAPEGGSAVKVYLDASALNRPFDDQQLARNRLETEAVLAILEWIESGEIKLVGSAVLVYENRMSPLVERREYVATYLDLAATSVTADPALLDRAKAIEAQGIKPLDALHLASAERGRAEWFVTCDDRILKRARRGKLGIRATIGTPIEFVAKRK
jgi:predicted nucleic acid-binding protein